MHQNLPKKNRNIIHVPAMNPSNDGVRRKTPPPTKVFRPAKGTGSYRR